MNKGKDDDTSIKLTSKGASNKKQNNIKNPLYGRYKEQYKFI
jgi:hypothetical protein